MYISDNSINKTGNLRIT